MNAFCDRQGKQLSTVRFLFDGQRVRPEDSPDTVSFPSCRKTSSAVSTHHMNGRAERHHVHIIYARQIPHFLCSWLTIPDLARYGRWGHSGGSSGADRWLLRRIRHVHGVTDGDGGSNLCAGEGDKTKRASIAKSWMTKINGASTTL